MKKLLILDFDFTLCDSSTRENKHTKHDVLELTAYVEDTAEHDKPLPLLTYLINNKKAIESKYSPIVLTNRDFFRDCRSPIVPIVRHNFECLHRGICAHILGDNFKALILEKNARDNLFIDDEPKYIQIARDNGAYAICARDLWHYKKHDFTRLFFGA